MLWELTSNKVAITEIDEKEYCTLKIGSCCGVLYCDEKRVDVHFQSQTAWNVTLYRNKGSRWSSKRWKRVPSRLNWQRIKQKMVLDNRGACLDNDDFCICFQNSFEESYFYTFTGEVLFLCQNLFRFLFLIILRDEVLLLFNGYFVVKQV